MAPVRITETDIDRMFIEALKWEPGQEQQKPNGPPAVLRAIKEQAQRITGRQPE